MSRYSDRDAYLDPESGVLKNRLDIRDQALLDKAEGDLVALRSQELSLYPLSGNFDLSHFKKIHRQLFRDVYDWAGVLRTVDISKGSNQFADHAYIESAANSIFAQLKDEECLSGLSAESFCSRAAFYLGELNALHPFRDGNGRTQREFIQLIARESDYTLHWKLVTREEMLSASIASFRGDLTELTAILQAIL
jgi:cell filamentation protein